MRETVKFKTYVHLIRQQLLCTVGDARLGTRSSSFGKCFRTKRFVADRCQAVNARGTPPKNEGIQYALYVRPNDCLATSLYAGYAEADTGTAGRRCSQRLQCLLVFGSWCFRIFSVKTPFLTVQGCVRYFCLETKTKTRSL